RSIFQLPAVFLFAASLALLKAPRRSIAVYLLITVTITGLYLGKQYHKFGIFSTSSFSGLNLARSVSENPGHYMDVYWNYLVEQNGEIQYDGSLPNTLRREQKIVDVPNFNNISYLTLNKELLGEYLHTLSTTPVRKLADIYLGNAAIYFKPSSGYTPDLLVSVLPWRAVYDLGFSYPVFVALLAVSIAIALFRLRPGETGATAALALPGLFIFLVSVLCDRGENMRFKFFLEPVFFVFIVSQFSAAARHVYRKVVRP
ncbi:MAG: hypothetical protein M0Z60_01355, partial [Nitrospiraceae bacterium]|nr:hypothetical protein [Nitrospiraceae bacterium]